MQTILIPIALPEITPENMYGFLNNEYKIRRLDCSADIAYPYTTEHYLALNEQIRKLDKPVITMSHYAFPGGNREAPLFKQLLPLPENVRMHFYGHAHIGDAEWAGKDCYRKLSGVDDQAIMQVNVASLENYRGTAVRSVLVNVYEDDEIGILFRNHSSHCWDDFLIVRKGDCLIDPIDYEIRP